VKLKLYVCVCKKIDEQDDVLESLDRCVFISTSSHTVKHLNGGNFS